jgi:hypothetical protein
MPTKRKQNCSIPKCNSENTYARGLCRSHYNYVANNVVAAGIKTWKQLEAEGTVAPPRQRLGLKEHFGV